MSKRSLLKEWVQDFHGGLIQGTEKAGQGEAMLGALRQTEQGLLQQQAASAQASVQTIVVTLALATLVDGGRLCGVFFLWRACLGADPRNLLHAQSLGRIWGDYE